VLLLSHSSLLCVHLFKSLVLSELLSHLNLELVLHSSLFVESLGLQSHLVLLGSLKLVLLSHSLFNFGTFSGSCALFLLLHLQVVTHVLDIFCFSSSCSFLVCKLSENSITLSLSLCLHGCKLIASSLLLTVVPSDEFFLVLLELLLTLEEGLLLIDGEHHVLLALLLLHFSDTHHLVILLNHLVDYLVHLFSLTLVLLHCLFTELLTLSHLLHNLLFSLDHLVLLLHGVLSSLDVSHLLLAEDLNLNACIFLL
jgi:hypothetical protein